MSVSLGTEFSTVLRQVNGDLHTRDRLNSSSLCSLFRKKLAKVWLQYIIGTVWSFQGRKGKAC